MIVSKGFSTALPVDPAMLAAAVRLNIVISAVGVGMGAGLTLFAGTQLSLAISGDHPGRYLGLLGVFMPGYSASPAGAWAGLFWGLVYGALSGGMLALLYSRTLGAAIVDMAIFGREAPAHLRPPVLLIAGPAFGAALGSVCALQLLLTTFWLILRGTAESSPHAALLSNYLPGYTTTVGGALMGAVDLFVIVFAGAWLGSVIYNAIARRRHRGERR